MKLLSMEKTIKLSTEFLKFDQVTQNVMEEKYTPSVIEPSFGFGRILYSLFEHKFRMRSEKRTYLSLPPRMAPIKCSILTVICDERFDSYIDQIVKSLKKVGIASKVDDTGSSIGKRYARTDEVGIPFGITIDHETLDKTTVTLREIDTQLQVRIAIDELPQVLSDIIDGYTTWVDVTKKYPLFKSDETEEA